MGDGYELKCKRCSYTHDVYDGIGFSYPMVCAEILEEMKKGAYGKRFMEDALNTAGAAIHHDRSIFVCDHCGNWRDDAVIDLCAPIGEPQERTGRFSVAVDYPSDVPYVMEFEIGDQYSVVRSRQHLCGKCRQQMRPIKKNEKLKCPECGGQLVKGDAFCWD